MTDMAVSVNHVSFSFGRREVLKDLSLEVPSGMAFGVLGPNGAGKTTLIRLLVGTLKPGSGDIHIMGQPDSRKKSSLIGYMPQLQSLYNELTVRQNVDFFAHIYRLHDKPERALRIEKILRLVDLWDRRDDAVHNLSGGMKQRTSLACAIVHNPPLLFLDEPTVGLDPDISVRIREQIAALRRARRMTILLSTHYMREAEQLCDEIVFLRHGAILARGDPAGLKRQILAGDRIAMSVEGEWSGVARLPGVLSCRGDGSRVECVVDDARKRLPEVLRHLVEQGAAVTDVSVAEPNLESVFIELAR